MLQHFPATGVLSRAVPSDAGFDAFWGTVNQELAFLSLEVRRVVLPPTPGAANVRYVGIANKARTPFGATTQLPPGTRADSAFGMLTFSWATTWRRRPRG